MIRPPATRAVLLRAVLLRAVLLRAVLLALTLWVGAPNAWADAAPRVSYALRAELDAAAHTVSGEGTISFDNTTTATLRELWLHLYLNAFEHERTLFHRSPFKRSRGAALPQRWGDIELTRLEWNGRDLLASIEPHSPGDANDRTDLRVALDPPIAPGARVQLRVAWISRLPQLVARTGYERDFHFLGQWFPKLAKLEADGSWNHFAFHPHGEFHSNFGDYEVQIDVPDATVVGASGVLQEQSSGEGRLRQRYLAQNVHDFAWVAWPGFLEQQRTLGSVSVRLLYPPGHQQNAERTWLALEHGLPFFAERYGPYPYPALTVVHPPSFASPAAGMEYPTLITTGGNWYAGYLAQTVEQVTLHELAHQWFYGLIASDEQRWPFLDEGLASYGDSLALDALFGAGSGISLPGLRISALSYYRWLGNRQAADVPVALSAADFPSFDHLAGLAYGRTTALLHTWSRVYGARFDEALKRYAKDQRFASPSPATLLSAVAEGVGSDASVQLGRALFERARADYAVARLDCVPRQGASNQAGAFVGRALIVRRGELQLPVEIVLSDASGNRHHSRWDGKGDWHQVDYVGDAELVSVVVDPARNVVVDADWSNNSRTLRPRRGVTSLGLFTFVAELLLHWLGA